MNDTSCWSVLRQNLNNCPILMSGFSSDQVWRFKIEQTLSITWTWSTHQHLRSLRSIYYTIAYDASGLIKLDIPACLHNMGPSCLIFSQVSWMAIKHAYAHNSSLTLVMHALMCSISEVKITSVFPYIDEKYGLHDLRVIKSGIRHFALCLYLFI